MFSSVNDTIIILGGLSSAVGIVVAVYGLYRKFIKSKIDKTLKSSRVNQRLKDSEEALEALKVTVGELQSELESFKGIFHEDDIRHTEVVKAIEALSTANAHISSGLSELEGDLKDFIKILLESRS